MPVTFTLNGTEQTVDAAPDMPLLWVLRDMLNVTGTKFGCGVAACGACTVLLNGEAVRSCQTPISDVQLLQVVTIEGLGQPGLLHTIQATWADLQVAQCGYCQSGQIMQAAALLGTNSAPTDDDIDAAMDGNLCRCGTYPRIRAAIHEASKRLRGV